MSAVSIKPIFSHAQDDGQNIVIFLKSGKLLQRGVHSALTFPISNQESPEMALIGTSTGTVYVVNAVGQLEKMLNCSDDEVMSITSDDDYIAVHCYDGCTTVWLKEGYIKWWNINMV